MSGGLFGGARGGDASTAMSRMSLNSVRPAKVTSPTDGFARFGFRVDGPHAARAPRLPLASRAHAPLPSLAARKTGRRSRRRRSEPRRRRRQPPTHAEHSQGFPATSRAHAGATRRAPHGQGSFRSLPARHRGRARGARLHSRPAPGDRGHGAREYRDGGRGRGHPVADQRRFARWT